MTGIELPADDLDSFVDMIETAKDSARGNLITIELKVCELAQTPHQTEQKRLPSSPSPNYERMSGSVHVAKNQPARNYRVCRILIFYSENFQKT